MKVEVRLFATLTKYLPPNAKGRSTVVDVPGEITIRELIDHLKIPKEIPHLTLVNGKHSTRDRKLSEGDVVSMFPPIAGG